VAALFVVTGGWTLADPIASMAVAILVFFSAWRLMRDATSVLLEATPRHIDLAGVRATLEQLRSVESVHDLHVWTVGGGLVAMSAHAVLNSDRRGRMSWRPLARPWRGSGSRTSPFSWNGRRWTTARAANELSGKVGTWEGGKE